MSRASRRISAAISRGGLAVSNVVLWLCDRLSTRGAAVGLLVVFLALFLIDGLLGVDFGSHWDEWYHTQGVTGCIQRMSFMPDGLSYGGPYFTLGFPVVVAHQWHNLMAILGEMRTQPFRVEPTVFPSVAKFKADAIALVNTSEYVVQVRSVFVVVTTLTLLWAFLTSLRCQPRRWGVAVATAAFMAFSWELGYHSRWVAIDAPLTQFCALQLFLFCAAWRAPSDGPALRWYAAFAAAAGAVFACKLTGVFAFLPVPLLPLVRRSSWSPLRRVTVAVVGTAIFVLCSFALSPEFYLDPLHLLNVFRSGSADYNSTGTSYPFYVSLWEHIWRLLMWLFLVVPSPYLTIAILMSVVTLVGLGTMLRRETRLTLTWMTFLVSFIAVFTHNHLFIVRQYLMCTPFLALCFGRGCATVWDFCRQRDRRLAAGFVVLLAFGFVLNGAFEFGHAWRITRETQATMDHDLASDLLWHRGPVRMSRPVYDRVRPLIEKAYECYPSDVNDKSIPHFIAYAMEHEWPSNRLYVFNKVYGADEINMNFYSFWLGRVHPLRMVDVPMSQMVKFGRVMTVDIDCYPKGKRPHPAPPGPGAPAK